MPHICRMGYLLAVLIGAALLTVQVWHPAPPVRFAGLRGGDIPRTLGGYAAGPDDPVPAEVQAALASATLTSRTYQLAGSGDLVNFVLIGGTDRSALHDPRSCLIGAGMTIQDDRLEELPGTGLSARTCRAAETTQNEGTRNETSAGGANAGGFDIIYFYLINGRVVSEATQIRAAMLWSALLGQRGTPVYFLRFTRPIHSDPRLDAAGHAALLHFATEMWTTLQPRLLPPSPGTVKVKPVFTKISVANIDFHNVTMEEAVTCIVQMAQKTEKPRYVCTGNLDHLVTLERDAEFRAIYSQSDLTLADGKPVVLLSHLSGGEPLRQRVTGSDLFWELARASAATGLRLFFLGGAEGAADSAKAAVLERYPSAVICGTYCPPRALFATEAEQAKIREAVQTSEADILLVGFGAPKQEKWIAANKDLLSVPVSIGVGGSFEMASGLVRRAPVWMQEAGLEWAYRFLQEPTRLFGRYFVRDLPFLLVLVCRALAERRMSAPSVAAAPILTGTETV